MDTQTEPLTWNGFEIRPPIGEACNPTIPCIPEPTATVLLCLGLLVVLSALAAKRTKHPRS